MRKHKRLIIILMMIILIAGTIATILIVNSNKPEILTPAELFEEDEEKPTAEPTIEPTSTPTPTESLEIKDESTQNGLWKQAYIDYIMNTLSTESWDGYKLILLDNDEIPELVAIGSNEAQGNLIFNYSDGTMKPTQLSRLSFYYIEKGNLLNNSAGHMDYYYDIIYSIIDGQLTQIDAGYWGSLDDTGNQLDEAGNLTYQYTWNGVEVTKEEYSEFLNSVFDMSKAINGYTSPSYSAEEIIKMVDEY